MVNRTIYFIYDNVKHGYCADRHGLTGDFDKATIYLSEANATKSIKERTYSVNQVIGWGEPTDKTGYNFTYSVKLWNEAKRRKKMVNNGFEIHVGTVTVPTKGA